jgi:hypothetical protein
LEGVAAALDAVCSARRRRFAPCDDPIRVRSAGEPRHRYGDVAVAADLTMRQLWRAIALLGAIVRLGSLHDRI